MTIEVVKNVIRDFLTKQTWEVLALKGSWGVGKTYAWKGIISDKSQKHWPESYAYVSLFGVTSLADLRIAILSNHYAGTSRMDKVGAVKAVIENVPWVKGLTIGLDALAPSLLHDMLICIDDLERLDTEKLSDDQVMGFISNLKETARCKIVLILNDEQLEGDDHAYHRYREKVVDQELVFAPTSEEATQWGLPDKLPHRDHVKKCTVALGISNVRVLRRISNVVENLAPAFKGLHAQVIAEAIASAVLLAWCYYDRSGAAPDLEFVQGWNWMTAALKKEAKKEKDPKEECSAEILNGYGFSEFDAFDAAIVKVIQNGYLAESGFDAQANHRDENLRAGGFEARFKAAWRLFHDSFNSNEPELVTALEKSFRDGVLFLPPPYLNALVVLLRELTRDPLADELIEFYISKRESDSKLFSLENYALGDQVTDAKIKSAFATKTAATTKTRTLREAVESITKGSLSLEDVDVMKTATASDFYVLFKGPLSVSLRKAVETCLRFHHPSAPDVASYAADALRRIAGESALNAARVRSYGELPPAAGTGSPPSPSSP